VNLVPAFPPARSEYIALSLDALLIAGLVARIRNGQSLERWSGLMNPWVASLLLVAAPWVSRQALQDSSAGVKLAASLAAILGVVAVAIVIRRWLISRPAISVAASVVIFAGSWLAIHGIEGRQGVVAPPSPSTRPNVVLISMDTVRADHLSLYNYERDTTPKLKLLAQRATVYRRAVASADMTLATHASLFTGVYPSWHGAHYAPPSFPYGRPLSKVYPTLAGVLASKGYATYAVAANFAYLQTGLGMDRGFQVFDAKMPLSISNDGAPFFLREGARTILDLFSCTSNFDTLNRRADEINADALRLVDRARRAGQPFFLFLNYMDAHTPYLPPAPFDRRFPGKDDHYSLAKYATLQKQLWNKHRKVSDHERQHLVSQYDGGIAYIDEAIAELISGLQSRAAFANTLFIVTADHGEAFGEKGLLEHGVASVHQNQVHIPLIIKYPGQSEAKVSDNLVSQVDVMPTVLEFLGYPIPAATQGLSLLHPVPADRVLISEAFPTPIIPHLERAVFHGPDKLIVSSTGERKYFDLSQDPDEEHNRYRKEDQNAALLGARLDNWTRTIPKQTNTSGGLNGEALQRLKSLGYVQ